MNFTDLSRICRLCLQKSESMSPIFGPAQTNGGGHLLPPLPSRIMSCARIELLEGDGLPSLVCSDCLTQVDRSYEFKLLVEKSDFILRGSSLVERLNEEQGSGVASDTDSVDDGGEPWDMSKFTPEVIIKEDGETVPILNGFNEKLDPGNTIAEYSLPLPAPPALYPIASLLEAASIAPMSPLTNHHSESTTQTGAIHPSQVDQDLQSRSRRCRGGDKLFKCRQCNKSYSFSSALSRHKAVHNTALRPHVCQICNKGFTQLDKLARHQKTHAMDFFVSCDQCLRPFKSYAAYQRHRLAGSCHNGSPVPLAPVSSSALPLLSSTSPAPDPPIDKHKESEPQQPPPPSDTSDTPPTSAESPSNGDGDPSPPVNQDSNDSGSQSSAKTGKGKPEFTCQVCYKLFATRGSLEVHSTIHTGVRPFVCSECNKSFRHKVNLMEHFQRKHSLVRPYICDVCAARFVTKQELVRHYRKHIGD